MVTDLEPLVALTGLERAAAPARQAGLHTEFGGEVVDDVFEQGPTEVIGLALAGVVLLVALGSVVAAGLPLAIALVGVGVGMSLVLLLANVFTISPMAPTIAAMVGTGVGIDYALFVVSRHRQQLRAGVDLRRAVALANASAGRSVVFAGCTVLSSPSAASRCPGFQSSS